MGELEEILKDKERIIEEHIKARQEAGLTMADMDRTIRDLRENVGALEDRVRAREKDTEEFSKRFSERLVEKNERIKELEEALRNKISGPKEQADQLNAELRTRLGEARKDAENHWALVLYAWSNLGSTIPHKMTKQDDFRKLVDDAKAEILSLRDRYQTLQNDNNLVKTRCEFLASLNQENNLAIEEWKSYREQTVHYAWNNLAMNAVPERIMTLILEGKKVTANYRPTIDQFRLMVDAARTCINKLKLMGDSARVLNVFNFVHTMISERMGRISGYPWALDGKLPLPENQDITDESGPWNYCQFIGDPPKEYSSWNSFMRAKEKKNIQIKAIGDWKQDLSDAMKLRDLEEQVGRLAKFIMENIAGEPSCSEGAIDCAIRLLNEHINTKVSLSELKMLVKEAYQKAKIEE